MKDKTYKVTEFSKATGLSLKALRLYESVGILEPMRMAGNKYRLYSFAQIGIANEIGLLRGIGFSLREIKSLLPFKKQNALECLELQLNKINESISALGAQRDQLCKIIETVKSDSALVGGEIKYDLMRHLICSKISENINCLSIEQIKEKTRSICSEDYLRTVAMVDAVARSKLLSVLSASAKKLVKEDLAKLDKQYANLWSPQV